MQAAEGPPADSEYPTELPDNFPIGENNVQPLLDVTELQAHLRLLGAIHKLKQTVQAQDPGVAAQNKDQAWVVFANRAVHRFYAWASSTWSQESLELDETTIPPLDVVMVWHTYLLNPRAYYEDSQRMGTTYSINLQTIQNMPLTLISSLIDSQTLEPIPPSKERLTYFETTTSLPFAFPLVTGISDVVSLDCPFCLQKNYQVKWISEEEKGYAQPHFEHTCEPCHEVFKRSDIGIRRFAEEVSRKRTGEKVYLSETLLDPRTGKVDTNEADAFTTRVLTDLSNALKLDMPIARYRIKSEATKLASMLKYDQKALSTYLHTSVRPNYGTRYRGRGLPRILRLVGAYSHDGLASMDLVGAILRQGTFIDKMVHLGWTQPGRFDQARQMAPLVRSIARYHAYLDLMASYRATYHIPLLVPTLDIDLAWHSHQLKGEVYRTDTLAYIGRTPNHDDNVEPRDLTAGYDNTARLWKLRFGVPYSLCGCSPDQGPEPPRPAPPTPPAPPVRSHSIFKIRNIFRKKKKTEPITTPVPVSVSVPVLAPVPPLVNTRPNLVTTEDDEADSSHPSEHNTLFSSDGAYSAYIRATNSGIRVASAKRSASIDPWRGLQAERNEKRQNDGHQEAFTDKNYGTGNYYPYWGVSLGIPFGYYGGYTYQENIGGCGNKCGAEGCGGGACKPDGAASTERAWDAGGCGLCC
ncbi:hypothetical protein M408DRAFT_23112 [Serendipita vermifera MAFF 305830]|uniref:Uncharacterized protein n=1 Tax=Serendipita vermifera MAFF 305830 TaxID=933852 RepID=A0A0C3BD20_SERVB|nr:hypothetical protein M408DRAFT_23112 [Serendipita vermifera MAFF 305830]